MALADSPTVTNLPFTIRLIAGALVWAFAMTATVLLGVYLRNRLETPHLATILPIYFLGALSAWITAMPVHHFLSSRWRRPGKVASASILLGGSTLAWTAFAFSIQYRLFYSQWHDPLTTVRGVYQFTFTSAAAVYQFLVLGLPLYLPAGILCLGVASLVIARPKR